MNPHNRQSSVTAQDVAELAGVSRAVVSRALSNNGSISPQTKQKVLAAAAQSGALANVDINLESMKDASRADEIRLRAAVLRS